MEIAIIGGGPAGSFLAYSLAKEGKEVTVFEEHKEIGNPIQCSGVITQEIEKLISIPKSIIINKITKVRFYSPNGNFFETKIKPDYVFDRSKLDKYIASLAKKEGVKFEFNKKFINFEKEGKLLKLNFKNSSENTKILIGADGPFSTVAKAAGIFGKRDFIYGMQARAKIKNQEKNRVDIFLGYGEFGWSIPESKTVSRIGVVKEENPKEDFDKLVKKLKATIINYQSGMIPLYNHKLKTQKNNIYLIGDAATMVKASTHGGLLFSMLAAEDLKDSIINNKNYQKNWKRRLSKELWLNKKIRDTLKNFKDKDFNELVKLFSQNKLKKILEENVRDYPSKFLFKILIKEPRLLKFSKKVLY